MNIIIISSNMTFFGLIGDLARVNSLTKIKLETDPPAIAAIVTIRPEMPNIRDSNSSIHHALSFPPGGDISKYPRVVMGCR
jgi:hypothetical protein